ncbi:TRIM9_67 [Mytilus edulis]|uniref:TRIM9_67 n=1 Tax=Mytilus edulis TaxID=6550 RepID=A0A8S3URF4_MYTED|nr:TRIM9_67 [Mytilus edulis]
MANSTKSVSIGKAQVPVSCHFCGGLRAKWKCEECDVFMCSSCKEKIHGKLISIDDISRDSHASDEVESEVVTVIFNSYTTSVPNISVLLCSHDDIVYILHQSRQETVLVKGKLLKASIRILETHTLPIFDFTLNRNDDVLFTNLSHEDESPVRLISSNKIKTVLDPKPMRFLALHVNRDDELICGLREQGPPFPVHDFSVRQIVIFGSDYRRKITLEHDTKGRKLFSYPACIRTDSKNVIYVVDSENATSTGKLLAVDRTGRLKFSYSGPSSFEQIRPTAAAVTPKDTIILLDYRNSALHVLSQKGILLAFQFLNDFSIETSDAMCIDNEGFLLIGCRGKGDENGKIHVMKIADRFI